MELKNKIYLGNCLEIMKNIPDKSIDLIICDLPFGTTGVHWDKPLPFDKLWPHYQRIIRDGRAIILFGTGIFTAKTILSNEKWYKYTMIWKKSKCGSSFTAKYRPLAKHEDIMVFGKSKVLYNPQMLPGEPYSRKWTPTKTNNHNLGLKGVEHNNEGTRYPSTILDFQQKWRRQDQIHPTQKPVPLLEWLIKSYSNEGDLILDNCFGSGSTLLAAKNVGRDFLGIEKEKKYYDLFKNTHGI
jgi:site-specific DNA-methyltransferase (adenine-specific)